MLLETRINRLFEIKYPILQGGMAWAATGELAAAVSSSGGLGIIGAGNAPQDVIREEIRKIKQKTDKNFAVNIMLLSPFVDDIVKLVIEEKVPIVTTGAGNPGKYIDRFKENGMKVVPVVSSVILAKRLQRLDIDAVIAEGNEAGGHVGELTTMTLIPQLADQLDIPIIAAGGIADGRGLAAALNLGAEGIQMGTRFVCSTECTAHPNYKKAILNAKDRDAVVTGRTTGHPVRNLKNRLSREIDKLEQKGVKKEIIEEKGSGKLREAVVEGNIDNGSVMAGQISGMIDQIIPVDKIIKNIVSKTIEIIDNNCAYIKGE
ncbi:MAG: enoyl-[acyl-carrier-protein] reductase FabK [Halanaerobiales bacterium]|nr:enoyl-[acyl-carrier-protein] reductase FabK [Halanaerobiales bacterium]